MKLFQTTIGRILAVVVLICLLPAMYISWQRNQVETRARTVEMVYDYDNILSRAAVERTTVDDLFALYRKSGITSLALYDETATKLVSRGDARVMSGSAMHTAALEYPEIRDDCVYIQPSATDTDHVIFNELKNAVRDNFRPQDIRELTVNGTDTIEVRADYQAFIETPLGIFPSRVKAAASHGFYVVLRPKNNPEAGKVAIDDFLKAVDASPKVSAVIFTGKDVLGFSHNRYNPYLSEELNKRHIPVVLIEAQNQLGFEPQQGILDMAREDGYRNVRLYAMSKDELIKLSPEEAWAGTLESMVDSRVVFYLKRYNRDYQDYSRQMKELCEKYPAIIQLIDGNNGVTLNDEEYQVFKTYSELSSNREMLERAYYYYFGQADMFHYQKLLKEISETKERELEQRNKQFLECMRQFRLEEAEKEFRFDPKYQKERDEVFQYEQKLRSMGLSEEIIIVIDNYLSALNAEWLRYGELAYQYGMEDILAMIKE